MGTGCSFCPTGEPKGTDFAVFHLPSFSHIIRNFGKSIVLLATFFRACFLLGKFIDPEEEEEEEGEMFLRNDD
jgi:hypothetical protein